MTTPELNTQAGIDKAVAATAVEILRNDINAAILNTGRDDIAGHLYDQLEIHGAVAAAKVLEGTDDTPEVDAVQATLRLLADLLCNTLDGHVAAVRKAATVGVGS